MANVAELVQVRRMTISRALNNVPSVSKNTRQRIPGAAERLGCEPDTSTQFTNSKLVASESPHVGTIYIGEIPQAVHADNGG